MKAELPRPRSSWPLVRRRTSNGGHCKPRDQLITGKTAFLAERREVHFRGKKKWSQRGNVRNGYRGFSAKASYFKNNVSLGRLWLTSTEDREPIASASWLSASSAHRSQHGFGRSASPHPL